MRHRAENEDPKVTEENLVLGYPMWLPAPISQGFGANAKVYERFGQKGHNGIDLAALEGIAVIAMYDGVVRFAGNGSEESLMGSAAGNCVLLTHNGYPEAAGSFMSGYAHLSRIYVHTGDLVTKGQVLGLVGKTGAATGPHLHVEMMPAPLDVRNGYAGRIDPGPYITGMGGGAPWPVPSGVAVQQQD